MGSKPIGYDCFKYLIEKADELDIKIAGLLTQKRSEFGNDHDLSQLALQNSIPLISSLSDLPECDIIYSVQYHEIIKQEHIDKARDIAVNLHMAPLPEYRGSNQFSFAILEDKTEFGTTIHQIDTRIDHGAILFQKRFPIPEGCWVDELYNKTYTASLALFKQTLQHVLSGNYKLLPQELLEPKYGTSLHYRKEMAQIKLIDMNWDKEKINKHIRATSMPGFAPPHCFVNGEKVYLVAERNKDK